MSTRIPPIFTSLLLFYRNTFLIVTNDCHEVKLNLLKLFQILSIRIYDQDPEIRCDVLASASKVLNDFWELFSLIERTPWMDLILRKLKDMDGSVRLVAFQSLHVKALIISL